MGVTHHPEFADESIDVLVNDVLGKPCFYCGKPTQHPAVFWSGHFNPPRIVLHPLCAKQWAVHLIMDAMVASGSKPELLNLIRRINDRMEGGAEL